MTELINKIGENSLFAFLGALVIGGIVAWLRPESFGEYMTGAITMFGILMGMNRNKGEKNV